MKKTSFAIVGSGWRSLYFVRIAKALPERFELRVMLCRTEEKAARLTAEYDIRAVTSADAVADMKPDFVVNAVSRDDIARTSVEWLERGFPVLSETPVADDPETMRRLWQLYRQGAKLSVAEQYTCYPITRSTLHLLDSGIIGEPCFLNLSMAHEYHGASLARAFLKVPVGTPFTVRAREFTFPTARCQDRYERFTDGMLVDRQRVLAEIVFENGRAALYDFDSEQYRSPIRPDHLKLQGTRGTLQDGVFYHLDRLNQPVRTEPEVVSRQIVTASENPNLHAFREVTDVRCSGRSWYTPPFGPRGLSEDETAIAMLMDGMADYAADASDAPYPLADALEDAWTAVLMKRSIARNETVHSEPMPWHT